MQKLWYVKVCTILVVHLQICLPPASITSKTTAYRGLWGPGCTELGWVTLDSQLDWSGCSSQGNIKQGRGLKSESPQGGVLAAWGEGHELSCFSLPHSLPPFLPPSAVVSVHRIPSISPFLVTFTVSVSLFCLYLYFSFFFLLHS